MSDIQIALRDFIAIQYGDDPRGFVSLWSKQTKLTSFFQIPKESERLVTEIEQRSRTQDIYLMLGLQKEALAETKRGSTGSVVAVPGFFADVDFQSAKGGEKRYPQDERQALDILSTFSFKPSWILNTGGGLHAHWLFDEPLRTDAPDTLAATKKLFARFQRALQTHFRKHDTEIDSVGDLARNHRIPGTFNHKSDPPRAVRLIKWAPIERVSAEQINLWLDAETADTRGKPKRKSEPNLRHERIQKECGWYKQVTGEGAADCDEPNWYAAASVTGLCRDGESIFHEYSSRHPTYHEQEATKKLERARTESGPRTCESIENALGFTGCIVCPHRGKITSPAQLGRSFEYEPGDVGPIALGFTRDGGYAFLDKARSIVVLASPQQLLSAQYLAGLAPSSFWMVQYPPSPKSQAKFDFNSAGEALIAACKRAGPFVPQRVRGRGIWQEGASIVINLGDEIPPGVKHLYLCFEPISLEAEGTVDAERLLALLRLFKWRNKGDEVLFLGWLSIAPICGVLSWRPHCFVYGPSRSGKTTLHSLAARLLHPLGISADGGSSEAGIRQTLGPDSLPVLIDEFESDQNANRIQQIVRLARSASSAENPVLKGTPEGKAMQFSLRTTFFFSGINPRGMSAADETRILQFELLMHDNDRAVSDKIRAEEAFFRDLGPTWCAQMVSCARLVPDTLELFLHELPGVDRRHRQNTATLLAGAFVALNARVPTIEEVRTWVSEFSQTVELHAQALDRDDAAECLAKLFAHEVERYPLAHWIAVAYSGDTYGNERVLAEARRIVRTYGLLLHRGNEYEGLLISNRSPAIEKVFERTQWGERGWMKALKKLDGAFTPADPVHFPNAGKCRCTGMPFSCIPEPYDIPETEADKIDRTTRGKF